MNSIEAGSELLAGPLALRIKRRLDTAGVSAVIAIFVSMSACVILARCYAVTHIPGIAREPHWVLLAAVLGFLWSFKELVICSALSLVSLLALVATRAKCLRTLIVVIFGFVALVIAVLNFASSDLLYLFGSPLTLNMILFSDVFNSENGRVAVLSWMSTGLVAAIGAAFFVSLAVLIPLRKHLGGFRGAIITLGGSVAALVASGTPSLLGSDASPDKASATVAFARSIGAFLAAPLADIPVGKPFTKGKWQAGLPRTFIGTGKIRNVILIVIESAAAEYLDSYGGHYGATPNLTSLASMTVRVDKAYAQAVSSTLSMGVLLSARYPQIAVSPTNPAANMVGEVLQRRGVSTAFFHSSDTRYGAVDKMLANSGFDAIRDFRHRKCRDALIQDETEFNSQGTTDRCTFADLAAWIEGMRRRPFFGMLWTFQTHYPYFDPGRETRVSLGSELADEPRARAAKTRYLNALHETDAQIGRLVEFLKRQELLDETLLIVTGDHGEAFGQHGIFGHGFDLFEESVRVPLLLINPAFKGGRFDRLTGHIDVAPTIADVLGTASPPEWQGSSLFEPRQEYPVFFFSPWTDLMVGYRDGDRKVISRLFARQASEYDLGIDPEERNDLLDGTDASQRTLARIAAWARGSDKRDDAAHDGATPSRR